MNFNSYSDLIKNTQSFNTNTFYRALVVDTKDPMKLGRIRIRIPALHGLSAKESYFMKDDSLPWAVPASMSCAGNDTGAFLVPEKGTTVFVTFEASEKSKIIYFGGIPSKIGETKKYNDLPQVFQGKTIDVTTDDYPTERTNNNENIIFKSLKGATIIFDDTDGAEKIRITDQSGQSIIMTNTGESLSRRGSQLNNNNNCKIEINSKNNKISISPEYIKLDTTSGKIESENNILKLSSGTSSIIIKSNEINIIADKVSITSRT